MNIDIVDSIDEKINLFNDTYDTDIIAVFPDKKRYMSETCASS